MSAINEFRIVGTCYQDTILTITNKANKKIAYCVLKVINSENKVIPLTAFDEVATRLNYLGKKGNLLQIIGSINTTPRKVNNTYKLEVTLVVNDVNLVNLRPKEKLSDRDFTDLFKLYDLPKYIPPVRSDKNNG